MTINPDAHVAPTPDPGTGPGRAISCAFCMAPCAPDHATCQTCGAGLHADCLMAAGACPSCGAPAAGGASQEASAGSTGPTTSAPGTGIPAGWYRDPYDAALMRWWGGAAWTDAVRPADPHGSGSTPAARGPGTAKDRPLGGKAWGLVGVVVAVAVVAAALIGSSRLSPSTVTMKYSVDVDKGCYETSWGYSDVDTGTTVEVVDGSGTLLGFGTLGVGQTSLGRCEYSATFDIPRSDDGIYRVTAGNDNRGYLNRTDDDVVDGTLTVAATLG